MLTSLRNMQIGTIPGRPSPRDGVQRKPRIRGRYNRSVSRAKWMTADVTNGPTFPPNERTWLTSSRCCELPPPIVPSATVTVSDVCVHGPSELRSGGKKRQQHLTPNEGPLPNPQPQPAARPAPPTRSPDPQPQPAPRPAPWMRKWASSTGRVKAVTLCTWEIRHGARIR